MSEEVKDASRAIPRTVISIWLINSMFAFVSFITVAYHLPDITEALSDPTYQPVIYVLRQSMSNNWMTVILSFTLFLIVCSNITYLAAVTRDIWAFARDHGLPFSDWIAKVEPKQAVPRNGIILSSGIAFLLSLIYIGSAIAFYAMTSLVTVALLQCYGLSIGCLLWRRIQYPETLPPAAFSLGKFGIPINCAAVTYAGWAFLWAFFPTYNPVTAATFNWASVLFIAAFIFSAVHFVFVARLKYFGPVVHVQGRGFHSRMPTVPRSNS
jgi:amino acid transporter